VLRQALPRRSASQRERSVAVHSAQVLLAPIHATRPSERAAHALSSRHSAQLPIGPVMMQNGRAGEIAAHSVSVAQDVVQTPGVVSLVEVQKRPTGQPFRVAP
jgi:hypothetical protein